MLSQTEQVVDIGSHETTGSGETTNQDSGVMGENQDSCEASNSRQM